MDKEYFFQLLESYNAGTATPEEAAFVERYLEVLEHRASDAGKNFEEQKHNIQQEIRDQLLKSIREEAQPPVAKPVHRIRPRYWWAAASILLLLAAGGYGLFLYQHQVPEQVVRLEDINAGKAGAILTLANGQHVVLDSLGNGVVATQGGATVSLQNGTLLYDNNTGSGNGKIDYNTMTTPKGRQYQLILPDGTKVWLNAASSLTYPTAFTKGERKVKITGEAYFEVAKNESMPFIVNIGDEAGVEVLGTSFNVNAYKDGGNINATLLEGLISITSGADKKIVKPGEQARISYDISIIKNADIEKALAWKNGIFNFEEVGLREMMMQIERWYNIEVIYAPNVPDVKFFGKMSRKADLATVLEALKGFGLHYEMMADRHLIVKP
jgi:ferric-dicitrate binding protein FerR (iron transport regulator)